VNPLDAEAFKRAMRRYPTGVTVVTSVHEGEPRGMTVNAFASVSAHPPTVLVCVNRDARSYLYIASSRIFCVNILAEGQRELAARFASGIRDRQFDGIAHATSATGAPILDGAVAYFDCDVEHEHHAGSHSIFIGAVRECASHPGSPLGYFDGAFRSFDLSNDS
jgi:flavin reductase (DIM6/NTAB) family NADH-FMN oxidoreductase RutF